jgi:hypothetical protein
MNKSSTIKEEVEGMYKALETICTKRVQEEIISFIIR